MGMGPYSSVKGAFNKQGLGIHVINTEEFSIKSSGWVNLFAVEGGTGNTYTKGNVGIGTATPQAKLHVEGNLITSGNIFGSYTFDNYTGATNYSGISSGNHYEDAATTAWHSYLHFNTNDTRTGFIYSNPSDDADCTACYVQYAVPAGMKQAYLAHLPWSNCRYFDMYGVNSSGTEFFLFRVSNYNGIIAGGTDHYGVTIVPICAVDRFAHIRIRGRKGRYHLMGLAWTKEDRRHNYGGHTGWMHVDNVVGAKSFVIQHPLYQDRYLVHACLEGPESGVYYRGKGRVYQSNNCEIELPLYFSKLTLESSATVSINQYIDYNDEPPLYKAQLMATNIKNGKFKVFQIEGNQEVTFNWMVFAARADIPQFKIDPLQQNTKVVGDGPYTYIVT